MSLNRRAAAAARRQLGELFDQARGAAATPVELATGVVHHLAASSTWQAAAVTACWWPGWTPATLADLLAAGRAAAITAHFHPPGRRRRGVAAAARQLYAAEANVAEGLDRGTEALAAWLVARALVAAERSEVL